MAYPAYFFSPRFDRPDLFQHNTGNDKRGGGTGIYQLISKRVSEIKVEWKVTHQQYMFLATAEPRPPPPPPPPPPSTALPNLFG